MKFVDFLLVIVIVGSAAFISVKLSQKSKEMKPSVNAAAYAVGESEVSVDPTPPDLSPPSPKRGMPTVRISTEGWDLGFSTMAIPALNSTPPCLSGVIPLPMLPVRNKEIANEIVSGSANVVMGFRNAVCLRTGDRVPVVVLGSDPEDGVYQYAGTFEVNRVAAWNIRAIPDEFFKLLRISKEQYHEVVNTFGARDYEVFAQVKIVSDQLPPALPPRFLPFTEVMTFADVQKRKLAKESVVVVDVRGSDEFQAGHFPGAINVPFDLPSGVSKTFSWSVRNGDILKVKVGDDVLLPYRSMRVVIVASGPSDPRAPYMLRHLIRNGYRDLGWLYDGVSALNVNGNVPKATPAAKKP